MWDLSKGYSLRSVPCAKMPLALCVTRDGHIAVTGHLDGSLCVWDLRKEAVRVLCVRGTPLDVLLLLHARCPSVGTGSGSAEKV